jgi:hypothetical protein
VFNGGNRKGLARSVSHALARAGYRAGQVGNADLRATTAVLYGPGASANAARIAGLFGVTPAASNSVPPEHVQVLLGVSATVPRVTTTPAVHATHKPSVAIPSTGPQGGAVSGENGIPCVN